MIKDVIKKSEEKMNKTINSLNSELATMKAGRANPTMLDRIQVEYYGSMCPLSQVANISAPEPRVLQISPWEASLLKDIEKDIEINEDGKNAIENAIIKAKAYAEVVDMPVFAMDDNLYLENVPEEKQPGVFVRRVNGKRLNDEEMIEHYTKLVKKYGNKLTAKWVYGMVVCKINEIISSRERDELIFYKTISEILLYIFDNKEIL